MRKLIALFVLVLLFSAVAAFADASDLETFDRKVLRELQVLAPDAVPIWNAANAARDAGRSEEAVAQYAEVFKRAPSFSHALRRQAGMELRLGRIEDARAHARQTLTVDRSSENLALLAQALSEGNDRVQPQLDDALNFAREATDLAPEGHYEWVALADVAIARQDLGLLQQAIERMRAIGPKEPATHVYRHIAAASTGNWGEAQKALDEARMVGLPQEAYQSLTDNLRNAQPFYLRWWKTVAIGIAVWAVSFALLLAVAALLNHAAMRAARDTPEHLAQNSTLLSDRVRNLYTKALTATSVFYYLSIPVVMLLVVLVLGGILYGFFALRWVPIKIAGILVLVMGVSLWSMLKSLFIRVKDVEPGQKLDLSAQPRLRAALEDVAAQIGTRPVDNVYLTPFTEVAVMERGKGRQKERCLILGVAAIDALKVLPFKAVLGHEYGHFTNRDTSGGTFALSVRRSLGATAMALAQGGVASWYNPAWLFVIGFFRIFLRISEGASRLQEILADRWAVFSYGAKAFEEGLRSVVAQSVRFDAHVDATLKEVVDGQLALANLYTYRPALTNRKRESIDMSIDEAIHREGSAYDSHPPAAERFALAHALNAPEPQPRADDDAPVWSLFANGEDLQMAMTEQVRENIRRNAGIEILAPA